VAWCGLLGGLNNSGIAAEKSLQSRKEYGEEERKKKKGV
jgi:hypothetical protein